MQCHFRRGVQDPISGAAPGWQALSHGFSLSLIKLNDRNSIPQVGLGVFQTPPNATERGVATALDAGYRHIDTAFIYGNEVETGRAIAKSGVPREDVFLVTKLWNADEGYDNTLSVFDASLDRLGVDRLTCT